MASRRARIYYDVTQLAHWQGKITGIPRVMQELAVRFYQQSHKDTVFVSWVKEIQEFCAVDFETTILNRGQGIEYLDKSKTGVPTGTIGPAEGSFARFFKKGVIRVAKKGLVLSSRVSPRVSARVESRAKRLRMEGYQKIEFAKGDRLFIPWGEWWDPHFIAKLEQVHGNGAKLVQILHDMSPIVVPQFSNSGNATETYPLYCRRIFPIADLILSVSQNSKRDATNWLRANKLKVPRIEVFRLGDSIEIAKPMPSKDPAFRTSGLSGNDFIMMVGTFELKKNHMLLYYVYKLAQARGIVLPKLVIVGRRGWMTEATYELMTKDPEVKDQFVFLHDTSDEELSWLYDKCLFTVLPSLYEGWGIPIAESVARGVPCICSNTSSMVEVAEGYVSHFSPLSSDECLAAIQQLLDPAALKQARTKVARYEQFSWDASFGQVNDYMKEIA